MREYSFPAEPHFDDERTLRSAQPVVPLARINKTRHRRQWFLGGAFAIAMVLGAATALIASYLRLRQAPTTITEVSEDEDVLPSALAVATPEPESIDTVEPAPARKEPSTKHRTIVVKREPEPAEPRDPHLSESEELQQIRQAVLVDEWQERRARRVERRERRRQERYNHRDLSNLDEIFEGRRRPNQ